jgi:hypothetical protein
MYFSCRPPADDRGQFVSYSAFVDLALEDPRRILGIADKPVLELGTTGTFDEFGTYPMSVIEATDHTIRAYYGGWTRCKSVPFNVAIGFAISHDRGETFQKQGAGPVLSCTPEEPFVLSGPKIRRFNNLWYLFYIAGRKWKIVNERPEPVYKIRLAVSSDGITWKRLNKDLLPSVVEPDEAQASPDVFFSGGKFHMFFCYRYSEHYRSKAKGYRIGYACSSDLENWERNDAHAGVDVSESGWDSEMVSYPHLFSLGERTFMAYLGNQVGRDGFGIAELEGRLL